MSKRRFYCYDCLRKFSNRHVPDPAICPQCNSELRSCKNVRSRASVVTRLARMRGIRPPKRRTDYKAYLASSLWRKIRKRVLDRDNVTCRDCGDKATDVHHLSYAPDVMAGENDDQLLSLCVKCHDKKHPNKKSMAKRRRVRPGTSSQTESQALKETQ